MHICYDDGFHVSTAYFSKIAFLLTQESLEAYRYTVGKITPVPRRDVRGSDFGKKARTVMFFPKVGSNFTPPHKSIDFSWKDYCPMVFR